jgi:KaiC/GvpD/RAD55 family RecA-like ATPase
MSHIFDKYACGDLKNRITLDYPLDLLLNRSCQLRDYEGNILRKIRKHNRQVYEEISKGNEKITISEQYVEPKGEIGCIKLPLDDNDDNCVNDNNNNGDDETQTSPLGTGNILIKGRPGTGKSTLALQMAVACTWRPNHYSSIFFSLEESCGNVLKKAKNMGWEEKIKQVLYLDNIDDTSSPERIGLALKDLLTQPDCCIMKNNSDHSEGHTHLEYIEPCVLLPMLSPRSISPNERGQDTLFWERYKQLEKLLIGAKWLRTHGFKSESIPDIRMACIDSLNVFGDQLLTRTELFKLFDLFSRYGVIGVFTAEQELEGGESSSTDSANYLADVVINLQMEEDNGYAVRYFEVQKSRYQHEVYGKHPLRMRGHEIYTHHRPKWHNADNVANSLIELFNKADVTEDKLEEKLGTLELYDKPEEKGYCKKPEKSMIDSYKDELLEYYWYLRSQKTTFESNSKEIKNQINKILGNEAGMHQPIMVQPSVHYIVSATEAEKKDNDTGKKEDDSFDLGEDNLNSIIKPGLKRGSVVTLRGPRGTYKTIIARNFLLNRIEKDQCALLINFGERGTFPPAQIGCLENQNDNGSDKIKTLWKTKRGLTPDWKKFVMIEASRIDDTKRCLDVYEYKKSDDRKVKCPSFIELSLKSGALLPEELLEFVRDILRKYRNRENPIQCVVLDDCSLIGVSYPFLRRSKTAGDMFLPAFVHIMRNYGIDLLINGTTGQLAESNEMVDRASQLADSVVYCDYCDVFGDRYVTISGEGLTAASMYSSKKSSRYFEYAPAVITADEEDDNKHFHIDMEMLKGLVGFETGNVHRPGLTIHLFTQPGSIYNDYKKEVEGLMLHALESSMKTQVETKKEDADINVKAFEVTSSDAFHSSIEVLEGKPIDRTVIYTLDEFWKSNDCNIKKSLADISDYFRKSGNKDPKWQKNDYAIWPCSSMDKDNAFYAVPFYANVLVVAYDKKITLKNQDLSWADLSGVVKDNKKISFYCDQETKETLSCLLIDCLIAANLNNAKLSGEINKSNSFETPENLHKNDFDKGNAILDILKNPNSIGSNSFIDNLYHLGILFNAIKKSKPEGNSPKGNSSEQKDDILDNDAKLQIGWYSQIRQLIKNHPEWAEQMDIRALPGRGFRGDWYLAIAKGSVSMDLGINAIQILTTKHEEYNRFAKGIGLPVRHEFMKDEHNFYAWPHSGNVKASEIFKIHRQAFSRASIPGYTYYRRMLSIMVEEVNIVVKEGLIKRFEETDIKKEIKNIVLRIPSQIGLLYNENKRQLESSTAKEQAS